MCFASFLTVQGVSTAFDADKSVADLPQATSLLGNVVPFTSIKPTHPYKDPVDKAVLSTT